MRNIMGMLVVLIFLMGCAPPIEKEAIYVHSEFQTYLNSFIEESSKYGLDGSLNETSIQFAESLDGNAIGICHINNKGRTISILRSWWNNNPDKWNREIVMYHELAHCALNRLHHNNTLNNLGYPASLLYFANLSGQVYQVNKAAYMKELFTFNMDGPWH